MKLKKKVKRTLLIILIIIILLTAGIITYKMKFQKETISAAKVLNKIEEYGYTLKDNKSKKYKELFYELEKILKKEPVEEKEYAKKIGEMFIYDFYSLKDKTAKTDIGGVEFIHPDILENFLQNAQNTYYKYVESNIYNNRNQKLPTVDTIKIEEIKQTSYEYNDTKDENAYEVKVTWTYTDSSFSDYQQEATLIFVHVDKKLCLVELN